ncbi:MAG: tetratricopeptide repeat protein [Vicinamibacterales bacterium]
MLHVARRFDQAIDQFRRTLDIDATFQQAHFDLSMSYAEAGRYADAIAEADSLSRQWRSPKRPSWLARLHAHQER